MEYQKLEKIVFGLFTILFQLVNSSKRNINHILKKSPVKLGFFIL